MKMTPYSVYWTPSEIYITRGLYWYLSAFSTQKIVTNISFVPLQYKKLDKISDWLMSILNREGWSGDEPDPFFTATLKSRCCNADVTRHSKFGADPHDDTVWYFCTECGEECEVHKQSR
jgi:hypothetical protein